MASELVTHSPRLPLTFPPLYRLLKPPAWLSWNSVSSPGVQNWSLFLAKSVCAGPQCLHTSVPGRPCRFSGSGSLRLLSPCFCFSYVPFSGSSYLTVSPSLLVCSPRSGPTHFCPTLRLDPAPSPPFPVSPPLGLSSFLPSCVCHQGSGTSVSQPLPIPGTRVSYHSRLPSASLSVSLPVSVSPSVFSLLCPSAPLLPHRKRTQPQGRARNQPGELCL